MRTIVRICWNAHLQEVSWSPETWRICRGSSQHVIYGVGSCCLTNLPLYQPGKLTTNSLLNWSCKERSSSLRPLLQANHMSWQLDTLGSWSWSMVETGDPCCVIGKGRQLGFQTPCLLVHLCRDAGFFYQTDCFSRCLHEPSNSQGPQLWIMSQSHLAISNRNPAALQRSPSFSRRSVQLSGTTTSAIAPACEVLRRATGLLSVPNQWSRAKEGNCWMIGPWIQIHPSLQQKKRETQVSEDRKWKRPSSSDHLLHLTRTMTNLRTGALRGYWETAPGDISSNIHLMFQTPEPLTNFCSFLFHV